ncbi:hypothetical protein [Pseudozobellia thermophila]|uniref:Uncharacterized protein n=1 Tax=Pseudozobellia thermophila TaxID=192903 RepID=A0A1M6M8E9_9FLAO|nr:hypothetical protein [Pseudozobellia thermophila]SHJ79670.1 hypothetical protein SAMN04488513_10936 [Pseudozobellia thermophila]
MRTIFGKYLVLLFVVLFNLGGLGHPNTFGADQANGPTAFTLDRFQEHGHLSRGHNAEISEGICDRIFHNIIAEINNPQKKEESGEVSDDSPLQKYSSGGFLAVFFYARLSAMLHGKLKHFSHQDIFSFYPPFRRYIRFEVFRI